VQLLAEWLGDVQRWKSTSGDSLGAEPFETASNDQKPIREDQFETNETFALVSYLQKGIIKILFLRIEKRIGFPFKILVSYL